MKTITRICGSNIKGRTFNYEVTPFTIFTGPNDAGKSAVIDALTATRLGYVPRLGKTNPATFLMASGAKMSTGLQYSDGVQEARTWQAKGDSVKLESNGATDYPPHALDATQYFAMTDRDRMKLVFGMSKVETQGSVIDDLTGRIKNIKLDEGNNEASEQAIAKLCDKAREHKAQSDKNGLTLQEWVDGVCALFKSMATDTAAAAKRMIETAKGLGEVSRDPVVFIQRELDTAKAAYDDALKAEANAKTARDSANRVNYRATAIAGELDGLASNDAAYEKAQDDLRRLRELVKPRTANTAAIREKQMGEQARLRELEAAVTAVNAYNQRVNELEAKIAQYPDRTAEVAEGKNQVSQLCKAIDAESVTGAMRVALEKIVSFECDDDDCGDGFDKVKSIAVDALNPRDPAKLKVLQEQHSERTVTLSKFERYQRQHEQAKAALDEAKRTPPAAVNFDDIDVIKAAIGSLDKQLDAAKAEDKAAANLASEIQEQEAFVEQCRRKTEQAVKLRAELAALKPQPLMPLEDEVLECANKVEVARAERTKQEDLRRLADAANEEQRARAEANQKAQREQTTLAVIKKAVEIVESFQGELVERAFGPLLAVANRIAAPILLSPLAYRNGEIGRWDGVNWVSVKTFGGRAQAVTYAAFAVALAAGADLKVCIIDELGRLDRPSRAKLFEAIRDCLGDGTINQFIGLLPEIDEAELAGLEAKVIAVK